MNIFSLVLMGYIGYVILMHFNDPKAQYKRFLAIDIAASIHLSIGYFLRIGSFDIDYLYVLDFMVLLLSFMCMGNRGIPQKLVSALVFTMGCTVIGVLLLNIIPPSVRIITGGSLTWDDYIRYGGTRSLPKCTLNTYIMMIKYFITCINTMCAMVILERKDWTQIKRILVALCKFMVGYGVVEAVAGNIFRISILKYIVKLFGASYSTLIASVDRGSLATVQGFTREPSHFAYALFMTFLVFLLSDMHREKKLGWLLLTAFLQLICGSFSSFMFIPIEAYLYWEYYDKDNPMRGIVVGVGLVLTVLFSSAAISLVLSTGIANTYLGQRIGETVETLRLVFGGNWRSFRRYYSSTHVRIISMVETFKLLVYRPLFGFGIGVATAHSSLAILVVNFGLIGTAAWVNFLAEAAQSAKGQAIRIILIVMLANVLGSVGNNFVYGIQNLVIVLLAIEMKKTGRAGK